MRMYDPPHPGLVLAESFDENFTVADAALKMGVPEQNLTDIISGKAPITPEIALLLAGIFPGETPELWIRVFSPSSKAFSPNYEPAPTRPPRSMPSGLSFMSLSQRLLRHSPHLTSWS